MEELKGISLKKNGFVNVTGLTIKGGTYFRCILAAENECGFFYYAGNTLFVITTNGEIWLHYSSSKKIYAKVKDIIKILCPNGEGIYDIEDSPIKKWGWIGSINSVDLLERIANPYWTE